MSGSTTPAATSSPTSESYYSQETSSSPTHRAPPRPRQRPGGMAPEQRRFQMRPHPNPRRRAPRPLVHVAIGYAIRVRVSRGRLVIEDGVGRERRTSEYGRTDRLSRLIVHGSTGFITLDAIRWLTATGAALVHLDHAGEVQATTARVGSDNPALRRAQALAACGSLGLTITREILAAKIDGQ